MIKLVFFGTSDRSVPILEALKNSFELVLCVTKEDVLVGRHQNPKEMEVKRWSKENGVKFVTIKESLKKEMQTIVEQIKLSEATLGIVADFGYIIPQEILDLFPQGLINIHFSLLPKYRGASPVQFALLNQDPQTGITYQLMEKSLDTGPIIGRVTYPLTGYETSGELYKTLFALSAERLSQIVINYLNGKSAVKAQDESQATYTYSPSHPAATYIFKEDARINWENSLYKIDAGIRAYNPWPVAWSTVGELETAKDKLGDLTALKDKKLANKIVKIYQAKKVGPQLKVEKIQIEGGKILSWEEFKNGYLL